MRPDLDTARPVAFGPVNAHAARRVLRRVPLLRESSAGAGQSFVPAEPGHPQARRCPARWTRAIGSERQLQRPALAAAVKSFCNSARLRIGSYDPLARLMAEVAPEWKAARCRSAIEAAILADATLKNSVISDAHGVLTDFVLTLAASRQKKVA